MVRNPIVAPDARSHANPTGAQVLNPTLHGRLQARFGTVMVAKQGEPCSGTYVDVGSGPNYQFTHSGEYYRVNCPFCSQKQSVDTRQRLWIHHRWGVGLDPDDPEREADPRDNFWWACHCFNEQCMQEPANRHTLREWMYAGVGRDLRGQTRILPAIAIDASLRRVTWPGTCVRVDQLSADHTVNLYLRGRGFDPNVLGPKYDVSFCEGMDTEYPYAHNRIIVPVYMNGEMVSWQSRPPYDINWKAAGVPKYYNLPGINKRLMLYGYEQAKELPFCMIMEGVTDVWAIGDGAMAIFGKTMAPQQMNMVATTWKAAVIVLDPEEEAEKQKILNGLSPRIPTIPVTLPAGTDPATVDKDLFWDLVHARANEQGVNLLEL